MKEIKAHKEIRVEIPLVKMVSWIKKNVNIEEDMSISRVDYRDEHVIVTFQNNLSNQQTSPLGSKKPRNRMKTKGWKPISKVNYQGSQSNVYDVFVNAMTKNKYVSDYRKKEIVKEILQSNGNNPNQSNIDYFYNVTMQYLRQRDKK